MTLKAPKQERPPRSECYFGPISQTTISFTHPRQNAKLATTKNMQQKSEYKTCNNKKTCNKNTKMNSYQYQKLYQESNAGKQPMHANRQHAVFFFQGPALCVASLQARTVQKGNVQTLLLPFLNNHAAEPLDRLSKARNVGTGDPTKE